MQHDSITDHECHAFGIHLILVGDRYIKCVDGGTFRIGDEALRRLLFSLELLKDVERIVRNSDDGRSQFVEVRQPGGVGLGLDRSPFGERLRKEVKDDCLAG
jgi:hypothetical protein